MTEDEKQEKLFLARKRDSFTSPTIDDVDFDSDGTYFWDCCNSDYCEKFRKKYYKRKHCMRGSIAPRCSRKEKIEIREMAKADKFSFPNDAK